jgi:hypothetical protein
MPTPDPLIAVLREWLAKADNDLTTAAHTLTLGEACPTGSRSRVGRDKWAGAVAHRQQSPRLEGTKYCIPSSLWRDRDFGKGDALYKRDIHAS